MQRAVVAHQDGFGAGLGRFGADVDQVRARRLGEQRRDVAGRAHVQCAYVQCFKHLRAGGEFDPLHFGVREAFFQQAMFLGEHQGDGAFLVADAQGRGVGRQCGLSDGQQGE